MRYALVVLTAALVAAAVLAAALEPTDARARGSYNGYVKACNGKKVYLKLAEKRTLQIHNRIRSIRDKPRLCIQQQLVLAARGHSKDMIRKDYFSHTSKNGSSLAQRVKREGYTPKGTSVYRIGENLGWGTGSLGSPRNMSRAWMRSDAHRKNLLKKGYRQVGIGVAGGEYGPHGKARVYTVDFGYRRR